MPHTQTLPLTLSQIFPTPELRHHRCLEALFECASTCWISADALLGESNPLLYRDQVRLCLEAAEVCTRSAKLLIAEIPEAELQLEMKACASTLKHFLRALGPLREEHEHIEICRRCCVEGLEICQETLDKLLAA